MMIFRILCGEWIEPLWDCMRAEGKVVSLQNAFSRFETISMAPSVGNWSQSHRIVVLMICKSGKKA